MANRSIASRKSLGEGQSAFPQRSCLAGRSALRTRLTLTSPTAAGLQQRVDLGERPETSPSTDLLASLADSPEGPLGRDWVDVLIFQIAREEAGRVMKLPVSDPR